MLPTSIKSNTVYSNLFDSEDYPDYYAPKSIEINAGVTLEPGVVIESGADVRFRFIGDDAFLNAEGTSAENIIFHGRDKVKGSWKALHLASNNANNKLNYVQILHAGSSEQSGQKTGLFIQSNRDTRVSIKNTTIAHSDGYGLYVDGDTGNITEFSNNNFSDNVAAPIRFGAMNTYVLDKNSVFENNGIQAIELAGGTTTDFNTSGTVVFAGLPYHVYSSFHLKADVTFESGVTCRFDKGMRMRVNADAAIVAIADSEPITFEGLVAAQGAWVGITIESPSPLNKMDGVIVRHGGDINGLGGNIHLFGSTPGSQLTIVNSTISDSETWGIHSAPGDANLTQNNNTFFNNKLGDILQE
ncbi:MAG: right-handed parallel beta-helix repeat-containing protein [Lentimicrobium sp.]|nr:right-handed parallel beta-helix repeat-containing protein [Lentimicrobium sp.]MDD2528563.1 right-handed parallel beta-helix repeat-containing protein [Lentimicrobiaceae bacterium]MDD4598807.1 right-handed parallel beta-helix repeat-containing protein [Lentimicrobiaceae bacterium]MDY0027336.1 right-handed parallel beta-helix repeat-containing protein [Lentimicrobium sp.]